MPEAGLFSAFLFTFYGCILWPALVFGTGWLLSVIISRALRWEPLPSRVLAGLLLVGSGLVLVAVESCSGY
jgi:membrane protein DedA with SNARE-associated domain